MAVPLVTDQQLVAMRQDLDAKCESRLKAASLDAGAVHPTTPSCWTRFVNCLCRKTNPQAAQVAVAAQQSLNTPQSTPESCIRRTWKVISWSFKHWSGWGTAASAVSLGISWAVFPNYPIAALVSGVALGFCGQTLSSKASNEATSTNEKKASTVVRRFQQHTSLATMMLTGYYVKSTWAHNLNCVLAGMFVRMKIEQRDELKDFPALTLDATDGVELTSERIRAQETCSSRVVRVFKQIAPYLVSTAFFVGGMAAMYSANLATSERALTASIAFTEYGLKGLCGLLGYKVERFLDARKGNSCFARIHSLSSKLEGIGIGFCLYGHQIELTNIQAVGFVAPIGYFMGHNMSRMLRINALEDKYLDSRNRALLTHSQRDVEAADPGALALIAQKAGCNSLSIAGHIFGTVSSLGASAGFFFYGPPETIGYDVFFLVTPLFYFISRFVFSKKYCKDSSWRKAGHLLFHKSPQLMSEQLNWALTDARAGAIAHTMLNVRIFYVFQGLLFGAFIEAPLFAIDEEEDIAELEQPLLQQGSERRTLLKKLRTETTRNFARMDLITIIIFSTFKPRV